jgi:hypothetical protein
MIYIGQGPCIFWFGLVFLLLPFFLQLAQEAVQNYRYRKGTKTIFNGEGGPKEDDSKKARDLF